MWRSGCVKAGKPLILGPPARQELVQLQRQQAEDAPYCRQLAELCQPPGLPT